MTLLANGNIPSYGIYPAVYYYRKQKKIFVVYGQSKQQPKTTWDKFLEKNIPQPLPITKFFSAQEIEELVRFKFNFIDNYAKAVFEVPGGDVENADIEGIVSALEDVILEYVAASTPPPPEFQLTEEQTAIVNAQGPVVKVNAFAGTGKTSTLIAFAQARPDKRILYLAFNKAICAEATMRFPPNVVPRTAHALAFNELKDTYSLHTRSYRPTEIAEFLENVDLNLAQQANSFLTYFLNSAEDAITDELFVQFLAQPNIQGIATESREQIVELTNMLFTKMKNKNVKGTFDFFLKMYQLSRPQLPYGVILFDEAQDASPVMLDIVLNQQNAQKVFVGDRHQQIYSFRYAVNALESLPGAEEFALTTSFRFGPNIARIASKLIQQYKGEKRSIDGRNQSSKDRIDLVSRESQYAYISRTNGSLFDMAARSRAEKRLCFVKEFDAIFQELRNVYYLSRSERNRITNPYIKHFESYQVLRTFANDTDDKELKSLCKIVEQYKDNFLVTYNEIQQNAASTTLEKTDIILSTAHTSKGLEFNQVLLSDDFIDLQKIKPEKRDAAETQEEINILYVAMTRAISVLQLPQGFQMAGVQSNTPISNEPPENIELTKKISTVAFVADNAPLQSLIAQFISSTSDKKSKTRYASQTPSINFEIEMLPCPRGIAYLTMLAHGNETGFGIYPAIYIYLEQRKLFVVYGQSKTTPPISWERQLATLKRQPRQIRDYFKVTEIESIQRLQPRFNFLDNYASAEFDLKKSDTNDKTVANIADELQDLIQLYGEYYTQLAQENFEDGKVHQTLAEGVKVRSKSEVIIANMLHERKIPFEYEKPLLPPDGSSFLPDFTININGYTWYWEHLGMLENSDYRDHWEEKQAWYEEHFSGQLITTEESAQLSVDANAKICNLLSVGQKCSQPE
jgi:superfamily I DNA/RNA helicase